MDVLVYNIVYSGLASHIDAGVKRINEMFGALTDFKLDTRIPFEHLILVCTDHLSKEVYDEYANIPVNHFNEKLPGSEVKIEHEDFSWRSASEVFNNPTDELLKTLKEISEPAVITHKLQPFKYNLTF